MSESLPFIHLGAPGEEISLKDLRAISERFKRLHQLKRDGISQILNISQRQFLDALPLILHANHPALPGFISSTTPAGIFAYHPEKRSIQAARQLNHSFSHKPRKHNDDYAIEGLFLMGSVGSIAFTKASDIDIWLCHRSDLTGQEIDDLQKKTRALENWAATLNLEVHFFLINSNQFLLGQKTPVSADSSGETQHYLLLEEFYRTSIYIAGKVLAWWLVPPEHENSYEDYLAHLLERRFIKENQILDLGGLAHVPANEFVTATQWHIYKALQSPYKSLLKLSLMECYASEYPHINWLCIEIKRAVYQCKVTGLDVDPYFLMYRKVEGYLLKSQSSERLSLIRHIFCRKVLEATGDPISAAHSSYLREIVRSWEWPDNRLLEEYKEQQGNIEKILHEHETIIRQLSGTYSKIMRFASDHINPALEENADLKLLGRKLLSFFEKKKGKIEMLTTRAAELPIRCDLSIVENRDGEGWSLSLRRSDGAPNKLYQRPTLIELLSWFTVNGLHRKGAPVHFESSALPLSSVELNAILERLDGFFKLHFDLRDSLDNYEEGNTFTQTMLIINLGLAAGDAANEHYLISDRSDPLSYGARRECLIQTIDQVSLTHWREVYCSHYQGLEGLFDCLIQSVQKMPSPRIGQTLTIICENTPRAQSIVHRIKRLFEILVGLISTTPPDISPRFIVSGGNGYFIFMKKDSHICYRRLESEAQLIHALCSPRKHFGTVGFDGRVLANNPIPLLYAENRPQTVQVFIHQQLHSAIVYILDENGTLYRRQHENAALKQLLNHYALFLNSMLQRRGNIADKLLCYEVKKSEEGTLFCNPIAFTLSANAGHLALRIAGTSGKNLTDLSLFWHETEFSSARYGDRLFLTVREHIADFRKDNQNFPAYINDIELPAANNLQTIQLLKFKEKIEAYLNDEINSTVVI